MPSRMPMPAIVEGTLSHNMDKPKNGEDTDDEDQVKVTQFYYDSSDNDRLLKVYRHEFFCLIFLLASIELFVLILNH